ncbi:DUF4381 family protein [Candidatus Electrothrix sp.]|uniref:DUF4381 family protein n=1 Tax=Candidatus Electrothrix sp. TaxID=2170559 RepID=UPI00405730E2
MKNSRSNFYPHTVGAGPCACPLISFNSGRTRGFAPTALLLILLVIVMLPAAVSADQVTAPLADPAQKSVQGNTATPQNTVPEPALTKNQLYDIREPIPIPDSNRFLWWIAAVLIGLLLLGLLFYFLKKRTRKQRAVLAHETALSELDRAGPLIEAQDINAFITLIDQTLRRYIEERFHIFARRQTTREFIHGLTEDQGNMPKNLMENTPNLTTWLRHCDLVKFAKAGLNQETMNEMVTNLRTFIESTKMEAKKK